LETIMLTCACGTRFEVDDSLAGQEVLCPECQQPLQAPAAARPPLVTSGWALTSVLLALLGAFTIVGTVVAIIFGIVALVSIARHRDRLIGAGFAVFGICLGVLFTVLTVVAMNAADVFGLETWIREHTMSRQIDTTGPLEVVQGIKGFAITRPTEKWGQVQDNESDDPAVGVFKNNLDLLLMQLPRHAFIDVRALSSQPFQTLDQSEAEVLSEFETQRHNPFADDDDDFRPATRVQRLGGGRLAAKDGMESREMTLELRCGGKPWLVLIRLYRRDNGRIFVVRAYAPKRRFDAIRGELVNALNSFRILPR
jgi:hypothetical protein